MVERRDPYCWGAQRGLWVTQSGGETLEPLGRSPGWGDNGNVLSGRFLSCMRRFTLCGLIFSGPVGMAAAAAVATGKKRKRPHVFESNPSIRKRQQTRLLR